MDKQLECWFSVLLLVTSVVVVFCVLLWIRKTMRLHHPPALDVVGNFCLLGPKPNEAPFALSGQHRYDVCLSFRGQDVRRTFVSHLHDSLVAAGVKVFLDSHNIERGNEISLAIQEAIQNSAILIPIFSKKFADSHWCLDEVAHMCKATGVIMPLFYDVKPTEVRNPRIGAYAEAFKGKKQRYTQERISEWESALQKVSSVSGWSRDDISRSDAELVKLVVKEVSEKLDQNATPVTPLQHLEEDSPNATFNPNILENENRRFVYELQGLSKEDALQHFIWDAFMRNQPEEGYKELSCKAVDFCNRLPFSLEVLGAHLYNKDLSHWNHVIQTLECSRSIPRLCYDGLNSEQKETLLDMACLFIRRRESVISFREASHLYPNVGLTEMKLKSLIKLDEHDRLVMHSQIRDTGRAIVADESAEPGIRSRLWKVEEVELVLMEEKGTERVRCLTYLQQDVRLQTHSFQRMCNLQLLWLDGTLVEGDCRKMPADLKWLRWENCPLKCLPCEWNMKHLVVHDLSFSKGIETLWPEPCNAEETHCLELLSFSANGVPECLEKKMETNGDDLLSVTLDGNKKCSGIIMCIMVRFKSVISSVDIELSTLRNGEEIFNTRLVNHSKTVEGDQIFVHILHKNHPMVLMVQSGHVVRAKADRDEERMIRSGGMQFFSEGEDGKRENLGRELTILMENYRESLAFEEEE